MPRGTQIRELARRVPGAPALHRKLRRPRLGAFEATPDDPPPTGRYASLLLGHEGRLVYKWMHYCEIYDRLLGRWADGFVEPSGHRRPLRFLEIGVSHGGSLEVWREFFGPEATIVGVDVDPRCAPVGRDDLPVHIGSQDDPAFLRRVVEDMGGIDVVLDDGSHVAKHQRASFDVLFPLLHDGGLYLVEDTHTAYWATYGGGLRRPGTAVERAKGLVDGLHAWAHRAPFGRRAEEVARDVVSVTFFDSVIAIEKGRRPPPRHRRIGQPSF